MAMPHLVWMQQSLSVTMQCWSKTAIWPNPIMYFLCYTCATSVLWLNCKAWGRSHQPHVACIPPLPWQCPTSSVMKHSHCVQTTWRLAVPCALPSWQVPSQAYLQAAPQSDPAGLVTNSIFLQSEAGRTSLQTPSCANSISPQEWSRACVQIPSAAPVPS